MPSRVEELEIEDDAGKSSDRQMVPKGRFFKQSTMIWIAAGFAASLIAVFLVTFLVTFYHAPGKQTQTDPQTVPSLSTTTRVTTSSMASTATSTPSNDSFYRLPKDLRPFAYELTIKARFTPSTEPTTFSVEEKIQFSCIQPTNRLVVHMKDLDIETGSLEISALGPIAVTYSGLNYSTDDARQFLIVELSGQLTSGQQHFFESGRNYALSAKFSAKLRKDNVGFFKTSYKTSTNQTKWLVASQMEPVDARRAFICFDEPEFKAKFKLTVYHDPSVHAISNMPVQKISNYDDWRITEFEESPVRMSAYLVALVLSDHECRTGDKPSNVLTRTCAPADELGQMDYCLQVAQDSLTFLQDRYQIPYPLKKLDHIALPEFNFGGMENWGAITYLTDLVYKNEMTPMADQQVVVRITSHEVNHQWFGNLVTCKWWDDLWLNEGFTRFIDFVAADHLHPEWNMLMQQVEHLFQIMEEDSKYETRAVVIRIDGQPDLIEGTIDRTITYGKGSMIVRMVNHILGEATFKRAITTYLGKYQYSNADQFDMWRALQESAELEGKMWDLTDFGKVMSTWTLNEGHPIVTIKQLNASFISLKQNRFVFDSLRYTSTLNETSKWNIPFTYTVEKLGSVNPQTASFDKEKVHGNVVWFRAEENEKIIRLPEPLDPASQFVLANTASLGIYRVNYDKAHWDLIIKQLKMNLEAVSQQTRGQLLFDAFAISRAGFQDAILPLELADSFMSRELDFLPLSVFMSSSKFYQGILGPTELIGDGFLAFMRSQIDPIYSKLGWSKVDKEAWTDGLLRSEVVKTACSVDLGDCVDASKEHFAAWKANTSENKIPKPYRTIVYCTAIRHGGLEDWEFLLGQYEKPENSDDKANILVGMSCAKDESLIKRYLDYVSKIDKGLLVNVKNALVNPSGLSVTWEFIKNNWPVIHEKNSTAPFKDLIFTLVNKLTTDQQLQDFVAFFNGSNSKDIQKLLDSATKYARSNVAWFSRNSVLIKNWLNDKQPKLNFRLSQDIKPLLYELEVRPYICDQNECGNKSYTFDGRMKMHLSCARPTRTVRFHSRELQIDWTRSSLSSGTDQQAALANSVVVYDSRKEWYSIYLTQPCTKGSTYELSLVYRGAILDKLYGFYRGSYKDSSGKQYYSASTDFQPANARQAFPCLDEPLMRSEYLISIIRHKNFSSSFSNAKLASSKPHSEVDWFVDTFEKTMPMSTYLVAFAITNYKSISKKSDKFQIEIEVAGRPEAIDGGEGDYALGLAAKIIDYYVDYFNISYPLTKSTQLAVTDYNSGAMENWGLIVYREDRLFYTPSTKTALNKRSTSAVIAHELAHQWFGNLVTPVWWNDLWLNEGFASWIQYLGTAYANPTWQELEYFVVARLNVYFEDSLETSHPISVSVNDPTEISALFDSISYDKGSYIIRMMNAFLSESTFTKGVTNYLGKYALGNAVQDNFWDELTKQAHDDQTLDRSLTIKQIMDTWTLQMGYPVVNVDCDTVNRKLTINQKWFLVNPLGKMLQPGSQDEYNKYKWFIPFTFTTESQKDFSFNKKADWIKPNDTNLVIGLPLQSENEWVIANIKRAGFYRVNYNAQNWQRLIAQLNSDPAKIDVISRCQLIDDSFNLGRAEQLDQTLYLDLLKYIVATKETESFPLLTAVNGLNYIGRMIASDQDLRTLHGKFVQNLFDPAYKLHGWSNIPDMQITSIYAQVEILELMCFYGNADCIDQAKRFFENGASNPVTLNNFKTIIYETVVRYGSDEFWQTLFENAMKQESYSDRLTMLQALTASRNDNLLNRILDVSANQSIVKNQDRSSFVLLVAANTLANKRTAFNHIDQNWNELVDIFRGSSFTLANMVLKSTENFNTEDELSALLRFIENHADLASASNAVKQAQENIQTNMNWMRTNKQRVQDWLEVNAQ